LLFGVIVSQTTGCVITSDPDQATINAEWTFHNVNGSGSLSPNNPCPAGFNTVALHNVEVDLDDRPIGPEVIDLFDCVDGRNFSDPLPPGVYQTFLSVTSGSGGTVYADSLAAIVDVTASDKTFTAQIIDNGGYFKIAWDLRDAVSNAPLDCVDIPDIDGVEIASTLAGTTQAVTDIFDCENLVDFSAAIQEGTYVVSVAALDRAGAALGQPRTLPDEDIFNRNEVTDLGLVALPIDP
jgi:hypothetical protein